MLLTGQKISKIEMTVPRGDKFEAEICDALIADGSASCAVRKDGGDDPDVTSGLLIYAQARYGEHDKVTIRGGEGIGRVTKPGLDRPVGDAAINSVPRTMIEQAVRGVLDEKGFDGGVDITISAPGGEEIAKKTFNPRLGIEGGISIIGTTGIVEPMSEKAVRDTIYLELKQHRVRGERGIVISPGNYGREFIREYYGYDLERAVKCSNFIGVTLDMCVDLGFKELILAGHAGKLVKVASGVMNTHSREADARMETIAAAGIRAGLPESVLVEILDSVSTTEAFLAIGKYDKKHPEAPVLDRIMSTIVSRIKQHMDLRVSGRIETASTIYCGELALVSETDNMRKMLDKIEGAHEVT